MHLCYWKLRKLPLKPLDVECCHKTYTWYLLLLSVERSYKLPDYIRSINEEKASIWYASVKWISAAEVIRSTYPIITPYLKSLRVTFKQSEKQQKKQSPCDYTIIFFSHEEETGWAIRRPSKLKPISSCKTNKQRNNQPTNKQTKKLPRTTPPPPAPRTYKILQKIRSPTLLLKQTRVTGLPKKDLEKSRDPLRNHCSGEHPVLLFKVTTKICEPKIRKKGCLEIVTW